MESAEERILELLKRGELTLENGCKVYKVSARKQGLSEAELAQAVSVLKASRRIHEVWSPRREEDGSLLYLIAPVQSSRERVKEFRERQKALGRVPVTFYLTLTERKALEAFLTQIRQGEQELPL